LHTGPTASILELADSIHAAQMQEDSGDQLWERPAFSSDDDEVKLKIFRSCLAQCWRKNCFLLLKL